MGINSRDVSEVNRDLERTRHLLIGVGCSFTEGTSAWNLELIEKYPPLYDEGVYGYQSYDLKTKKEISSQFSNVSLDETTGYLSLYKMQTANSFVNVLAEKFYNKTHTPLNLGNCATGNLAAVLRLFLYPINYKIAKSITVIFCPTSLQRFDFIRDNGPFTTGIIGNDFTSIWPYLYTPNSKKDSLWKFLHDGYRECIWSEKFEVLNAIIAFSVLNFWCTSNNARLVVVPAFNKNYTKDYFKEHLQKIITRDGSTNEITEVKVNTQDSDFLEHYLNLVPWNKFFKPQNQTTFYHLALSQEKNMDQNLGMYDFIKHKQVSPNKWLMACGHPSAKSHSLFAEELYKHLENNNENCI